MMDIPSCLSCGTCCFSNLPDYVRVEGKDYERLGDAAESMTRFIGNRAYMAMVDGHCAALREGHDSVSYVCSVYENRPQVCRDLERGSPQCLGERDTKGDRPGAWITLRRKAQRPSG